MRLRRSIKLLVIVLLVLLLADIVRLSRSAWLVYQSGLAGRNYLQSGWQASRAGDWPLAHLEIDQARQSFSIARQHSQRLVNHLVWSRLGWYQQQTESAYHLFRVTEVACITALDFFGQIQQWQNNWPDSLNEVSLEHLTASNTPNLLSQLKGAQPLLIRTLANLHAMETSLAKIEFASGLSQLNAPVAELRQALETGKELLAEHLPWLQLAPYLANQLSDGRFLLILQNNDELRPTGGFIGNYGLLGLQDGRIVELATYDSYHLDMPAQDYFKPSPPLELNQYLGVKQWFLRDANWSPDFPTAAQQIGYFYQEQTKVINKADQNEKIDGVIAITPTLIEDLLGLVGPITIEDQTYNQQNFVDLLQYRVEMSYEQYGVSSWNRKAVINDVIAELEQRLLNLPTSRWPEVAKIITKNLERKNILLFSYDSVIEQWLIRQNWSGHAREFDGDYLWVIDANLAAYKTDAVVDKQTNYRVYKSGDDWLAELTLNYRHNGGFDWRTTRYRSYTRIYTPLGSQLISYSGFKEDVVISQEFNKTVFAGFLVVEPKKSQTIKLTYKLSDKVVQQIAASQYNLLLQKQPGRQRTSVNIDLQFINTVKRAHSEQLPLQIDGSTVKGQSGWLVDNQLSISF